MPVVSARSASKNMSRSRRSKDEKNARRVAAAIADELELCTYGKIAKACGNKMFRVITDDRKEHLAYIRGKMTRVNTNDIVLLSIREYESRAESEHAVFDIMAVFSPRDIAKLAKNAAIPSWMSAGEDKSDDLFEDVEDDESSDDDTVVDKKDKKSHRPMASVDSDINVDDI